VAVNASTAIVRHHPPMSERLVAIERPDGGGYVSSAPAGLRKLLG
jgi:hypothetical protein